MLIVVIHVAPSQKQKGIIMKGMKTLPPHYTIFPLDPRRPWQLSIKMISVKRINNNFLVQFLGFLHIQFHVFGVQEKETRSCGSAQGCDADD